MPQIYPGIWYYQPSTAGAVIMALCFLAATLLHTYQLVRTRTWHWAPFVLGGYCEAAGYIARAVAAVQTPEYTLPPYVVDTTLVLIAPALFAAGMYLQLGRIIRLAEGEKHALVRVSWLGAICLIGDVVCFFTQAAGKSCGLSSVHADTDIPQEQLPCQDKHARPSI